MGDFDGDGFSDLAVACAACGASTQGEVLVFTGSAAGPSATPSWTLTGEQLDEEFGSDVARAGDVNADGLADLLVGAAGWDGTDPNVGRALLYLGSPDGPSVADWSAESTFAGAAFGHAVSGARDIDGDGYDDLLIGAPYDADTLLDEGKVYLYLGGASGPAAAPAWEGAGLQAGAAFGWDVSWAGDLDSDGYADFVVGAPLSDQPGADGGAMFGFVGAAAGAIGPASWVWGTKNDGSQRGRSVAGIGDDNGDGTLSVAYGSPLYDVGADGGQVGEAAMQPSGSFSVWSTVGAEAGAELGAVVAGGGDLDGDGTADLVAGAPLAGGAGEASVHLGGTALVEDARPWASRPQARSPGGSDAVPPLGRSESQDGFDLVLYAASPFGRTRATLEYEVQPTGTPFDASAVQYEPAAWVTVGCPSSLCVVSTVQELTAELSGLDSDTAWHWRARVRYDPAQARPMGWSRWYYGGRDGEPEGVHLRTGLADADGDGWPALAGDCDDEDDTINPDVVEICDGVDEDCDGTVDNGFDEDGDGVTVCGPDGVESTVDDDCDDEDDTVFPDALETCDADDDDCDGDIDEGFDEDDDGVTSCGPDGELGNADDDCDDDDPTIFPGAAELCDGVDQNCNDSIVDEYTDFDLDDVPDCEDPDDDNDGDSDETDCNDFDDSVFNGAPEECDDIDSNCNGSLVDGETDTDNDALPNCVDEDDDNDGFEDDLDCAPLLEAIYPGAPELCDGVDSNCDGDLVDQFTDLELDGTPDCVDLDVDGDGHPPPIHGGGDCDDLDADVFPGQAEACDGLDTNCDGVIPDDEDDDDNDTWRVCDGDCDDADPAIHPDLPELCNGIDDDCSGEPETSDELSFDDWFLDSDSDGYGNPDAPHPDNPSCDRPDGYVLDDSDCDDSDPAAHPGATEVVGNALDEDCDGVADGAALQAPAPGCNCEGGPASFLPLVPLMAGLGRRRRGTLRASPD